MVTLHRIMLPKFKLLILLPPVGVSVKAVASSTDKAKLMSKHSKSKLS